jgi:predicted DNA-binding helix-hairpin-helix protein
MFYNRGMDGVQKLLMQQDLMDFEVAEEANTAPSVSACSLSSRPGFSKNQGRSQSYGIGEFHKGAAAQHLSLPIHYAVLPNGGRIPLLKTALTTACERHCNYCAFRSGRDFNRQTFSPDEMARTFMQLYQAGIVKGLFISSGVAGGGVRTQDRLIDTAEILRGKLHFDGYIHLKIMPGAEKDQILRGMQLSDRISVNLEAPTSQHLARLAPEKIFIEELLQRLTWVEQIRNDHPAWKGWKGHWPSSTTQFVVGASTESDLELLQTTLYLHKKLRIARAYFSGFKPVLDTPFEDHPPINLVRQNRLYQASFLLRDYAFDFEEFIFDRGGNLPLDIDPKLAWAKSNLFESPVEINKADYLELIRVPGIGVKGAKRIIAQRKQFHLHHPGELKALGIAVQRALPFIILDGIRPPVQPALPIF